MKQAIITAFLGKTQDRFSEYHEATELRQRLELVSKISGTDGVEVVFPYETGKAEETTAWMSELNLNFAAINANIKKEPKWASGSMSRESKEIRKGAIEILKGAKDFAEKVGAPLVTTCPLTDGYDNLFQVNYGSAWNNMLEAFGEAAAYKPEIPLFLEYKYSETRVNCHLDTCAKTLLFVKELGLPSVGVTIDFGHALYAQENPAASIALCAELGVDFYLHTNDNDCRFDWDLMGGTRNFLHYAEFIFYAQHYGYDKYYTTDASPRIFEMLPFFDNHAKMSLGIYNLVSQLDKDKFLQLMHQEKGMELFQLVREEIYRLP